MAGNDDRHSQRRFGEQQSSEAADSQQSGSDSETSPVPSTTFSDFNDASSKADTESLPAWNSSWSLADDSHTTSIADPQNDIRPAWIVPSSPPSPPLRYDPRCRASSPETPSPLYAKWQKPRIQAESMRPNGPSCLGTTSQLPSIEFEHGSTSFDAASSAGSARVSRASSWLSSSNSSISSTGDSVDTRFFVAAPHIPALPFSSLATQSHMAVPRLPTNALNHPSQLPIPSTSTSTVTQPRPSYHAQTYSTALGTRTRPGLAKLSRFREPTSSGKKRVIQPAKHAHKRSCSVQWQQFERWQRKSRARLRDLLLLLLTMAIGALIISQLCFPSARPESTSRRRSLKIPHLVTLPQPHRDTMVIYRILGNDLPPRHEVGQTLRNLRFMLSHEDGFSHFSSPSFSPYNIKIDKYYVLNRITNDTAVEAIMSLFAEFGVPENRILNIPFEIEEYDQQGMRWDGGVATTRNLWGIGAPGVRNITAEMELLSNQEIPDTFEMKEKRLKKSLMTKLRAMEYATHDKNLYAINNNGGRNYALHHGRSLPNARWILPLDGNCFLTPPAMASMIQTMASEGEGEKSKRHVILPMNRLLDNQDVFEDNVVLWDAKDAKLQDLDIELADAPEEPQIGFRWDSPVSYQSSMRYGRRSKLELLWRLGAIPFARGLHIKRLPWEKQDHLYITPHSYASAVNTSIPQRQTGDGIANGDFAKAGWVHRLFSGDTSQEYSTTRAAELRRLNRMRGIVAYLENLDLKAKFLHGRAEIPLQDRLWSWNARDLLALKGGISQGLLATDILQKVHKASERLLNNMMIRLERGEAPGKDLEQLERSAKEASHLAMIGYLTSNPQLVRAAVKTMLALVPASSSTEYETVLEFGQPPIGYAFPSLPSKLLNSPQHVTLPYNPFKLDITSLVDLLRLVRLSGSDNVLNSVERRWLKDMDEVLARHLRVLLLSKDATELSAAPDSYESAMRYDTSTAALSAYFDMPSVVSRVHNRHHLRYLDSATGDPSQESRHPVISRLYETFQDGLNNVASVRNGHNDSNTSIFSIIEQICSFSM